MRFFLFLFLFVGCSEQFKRSIKDVESNWTGGLNRTCKVYSNQGQMLAQYNGRFDLRFGDNRIFFDRDGKRTIIVGGTVVCDEQ